MDSDDLSAAWRRYDVRLDEIVRTNALIFRRSSLAGTRTALGRLRRTLWYELVMAVLAVLLVGAFTADHVRETPVAVAATVLYLYTLAILAWTIVQLVTLGRIDFDRPVMTIARAVEQLELIRARQSMWTLVLAPLMWAPLALVATRALIGLDPIAVFGIPWIVANVAFGIAVLALAVWLARHYGRGPNAAAWLRRFSDTLSGSAVRTAAAELETLLHYEDE